MGRFGPKPRPRNQPRICPQCKVLKEPTEFWKGKSACKDCSRARIKQWRAENPGYKAQWRRDNPERERAYRRRQQLKREYGITIDTYNEHYEKQGGFCRICGQPCDYTLHVDHCHTFGHVRGLLCRSCNRGLGMFQDSRGLLMRAIKYLKETALEIPPLKQTTIIGLGSKARQGKDYAAKVLERLAPGRARRFALADVLYAYCRIQYGMEEKDPILLQEVGLNFRQRDPDVWVRACLWHIQTWDADATGPQVAVIPDIRFPNEAEMVLRAGGHLVRIERYVDRNGTRFVADDRPADHPSEIALDDYNWPHTLVNVDGELEEFARRVEDVALLLVPAVFSTPRAQAA